MRNTGFGGGGGKGQGSDAKDRTKSVPGVTVPTLSYVYELFYSVTFHCSLLIFAPPPLWTSGHPM